MNTDETARAALPTPRTNAIIKTTGDDYNIPVELARQLERELAAATAELDSVRGELADEKAVNRGLAKTMLEDEATIAALRSDGERWQWLAKELKDTKWADMFPGLKPEDEKYITIESLNKVFDAARQQAGRDGKGATP